MKFCFLAAFVLLQTAPSFSQVPVNELKQYAIASIRLAEEEYTPDEKYFVLWQGKPTAFKIHVQAGFNIPSDISRQGDVQPDIKGVKVRVRAFDATNKEVGEINKPGKADDTFFTRRDCTFAPPKPGNYRLTLEVLIGNQVIPVISGLNSKTTSKTMHLLVHNPPTPQWKVHYTSWREVPDQPDVYERKISVDLKRSSPFIPKGYAYRISRSDIPRWLSVKLQVAPLRPLKLSASELQKVSWLSTTQGRLDSLGYTPEVATQYFRYDPTRDLPRDLDFYEVKIQAVK